jgi:lysophospholipase L1-like esterase
VPAHAQAPPGGILVVGDSLEVGTSPNLAPLLPGATITVDAEESRSSSAVLDALAANLDASHSIVVFDAGTNDDPAQPSVLTANLAQAAELAGDRCMVVATINRPPYNGIGPEGLNAAVTSFAASRPNTQLVDWQSAALSDPGILYSDGVHPTPQGYRLRAQLIAQGITACATGGGVGSTGEAEVESPPPPEPPRLTRRERLARARAETAAILGELFLRRLRRVLDTPADLLMLGLALIADPRGTEPGPRRRP